MDSEKTLISHTEKYYTDEGDIDFKMTYCEHQLLLECLSYCLSTFDFAIPLYMHEDYLLEETISYRKSDSIINMIQRLACLMDERTDTVPYEKIEEYVDKEGHKSYVTVPLNDN
jgi:hypothetical protein